MIYRRTFEEAPDSVRQARLFAATALDGTPLHVVDTVTLMVSELATNAIQHADSAFEVVIDREPERVLVSVSDTGDGSAEPRQHRITDPRGRGLQIVGALADEWGVHPGTDHWHKSVWFAVLLPKIGRRGAKA